ncbi:MAG: hypothetical protein JWP12_1446 [Bacteroidetes bacterium]|nr:hypothetical protein [Bacteroidota bacterium]
MNHSFSLRTSVLLLLMLCVQSIKAQDTIYKNDGTVIYAKIMEVGTNAISFKKTNNPDGPTFIENKTDISLIKYRNGEQQEFVKVPDPGIEQQKVQQEQKQSELKSTTLNNPVNANPPNDALKNGPVSEHYHIEELNGRYTINGQKLGKKSLDRQLAKSKNPAVRASLKTAKAFKISQKIIGLTSYATTAGGGVTSIATVSQFVTAYQTKTLSPKYYMNAGLSLLGTMALPITSGYLKKFRDKAYDKTIDLYNVTN